MTSNEARRILIALLCEVEGKFEASHSLESTEIEDLAVFAKLEVVDENGVPAAEKRIIINE